MISIKLLLWSTSSIGVWLGMSVTGEPEPSSFSPILVVLKVEISFFGVAVLFELLDLDTASEVFDDLDKVVTENYICKSKRILNWNINFQYCMK